MYLAAVKDCGSSDYGSGAVSAGNAQVVEPDRANDSTRTKALLSTGHRTYIHGLTTTYGMRAMNQKCCFIGPGSGALSPRGRQLLQLMEMRAAESGMAAPRVISACRSRADQMTLRQRWDSGDRRGMAYRPAHPDQSRHVPDENGICHAFDVGNTADWCDVIGKWVRANVSWATWGGEWMPPDKNHFQVDEDKPWKQVLQWRIG